ncbi:transcription termination/antitermination protein NusG [Dissulfurirhabdus thermomarina]|uniref:Transcription termination/antitermination protein NusG n=1 Tax=Dissulfurirhabdus thermomarina TaxID=1765737 RepID=A0A6N9TQF4_DISTH|nr:transcription termination/antitermination protein NusG [Dissulfurirhabdus thermomarina]NDY42333.1 transcription termination/antitermination protein NusG [Dissulfurirhabdus thermomarina]NMX23400.1 transcription termination/antitermination protein NusG [Dissulfurirhabdus thermomarina]
MAHKWYIVHTYSGFENKVKAALEERIKQHGLEQHFSRVVVPTEKVVEIVKGERRTSSRKVFPGYILVKMELNNETWHLVQDTPKVTGFIGSQENPVSLPDEEAERIIQQMEERALKPVPKYDFQKGDQVTVTEGPFANFHGEVDEVKPEKGKVRVMVSIFGRATPVELEFAHVQKVS